MKIALIHSRYKLAGGEDQVFDNELALLEGRGHEIVKFEVHNEALDSMSRFSQARSTIWNAAAYRQLSTFFAEHKPKIAHFHNTFPLISPAGYYAARRQGIPVVQTLHNYRLLCANALFYRDGHVCEDCLGKFFPIPSIRHACYRESKAVTGVVASMLVFHRLRRTFQRQVNAFIALTEFTKGKFIEGGLPVAKIHVKPNFLDPDPGVGGGTGDYSLYVGRLSYEKGVQSLVEGWLQAPTAMQLKIVGDGPDAPLVREACRKAKNIEWLGRQPKNRVIKLMKDAAMLVFPSVCYENMPLVVAEAFATGLPIMVTDLPSMSPLITPGLTGVQFKVGDPVDLAAKAVWATENLGLLHEMRPNARAEYEAKYTADVNYAKLMEIYGAVSSSPR